LKQENDKGNYTEWNINNHFSKAPVYYSPSTTSTMDDARVFTRYSAVHGTVMCTGFQTKGRGRRGKREWASAPGENLLFTIILKKDILPFPFTCLPVITGLTLCLVCEGQFSFSPLIKWPNDLLFKGKKFAGILCEAEKDTIFCGIGINCNQVCFPDYLEKKATSLCLITGGKIKIRKLCENILFTLKNVFGRPDWQKETEKRLYRKGDRVRIYFPDSVKKDAVLARGILHGLDSDGALLVMEQEAPVRILAGEIMFVSNP
jgi:BirA family biotin operon repressor/biotin-[acetyl-CoA-carboxylase] ligase